MKLIYAKCLALNRNTLSSKLLAYVGYVGRWIIGRQEGVANRTTAITFLAQWHPLIVPERSDLRPEFNGGPKGSNQMF